MAELLCDQCQPDWQITEEKPHVMELDTSFIDSSPAQILKSMPISSRSLVSRSIWVSSSLSSAGLSVWTFGVPMSQQGGGDEDIWTRMAFWPK